MSGEQQLRAYIERILRLKEEQDSLAADIREIYAEAKGSGFDKTAMGQLVSHLRKVERVGVAAVEEGQSTFDLYLSAYERATGTPIATHTHEASQSYAEAKPAVVKNFLTTENATPSELTDTQEQPGEPATQSEKAASAVISPNEYAGTSSDENPATISNPQPAASLGNADGQASTSSSEPGSLSEKKDCLKLKDGHCKISFDTPALCAVCNAERMKARAA